MKFLDKLKKLIGVDLSKLKEIKLLHISVNIDKSVKIDASNSSVTINPERLTGKQKRALKQLLRNDGLEESGAILHQGSMATVDLIKHDLPLLNEEMAFLLPMIPQEDVPLLQACLFLRRRFNSNQPVDDLKRQIVQSYGPRGRNLANLCSAGYLETWFKPVHAMLSESYPEDPAQVRNLFLKLYNHLLVELPWTVFVCSSTNKKKLALSLIQKLKHNASNGVRFLNIHGLGEQNAKKISSILLEVQNSSGARLVKLEQDGARIFARLEFPPGN